MFQDFYPLEMFLNDYFHQDVDVGSPVDYYIEEVLTVLIQDEISEYICAISDQINAFLKVDEPLALKEKFISDNVGIPIEGSFKNKIDFLVYIKRTLDEVKS